jgi:hypothetical protein
VSDTEALRAAGRIELGWSWTMHWLTDWVGMADTVLYEDSWRRGRA